ncbi:MAG TPA: sodium:solute symporter family protein [bacterium]|mgnify:CR=1 FL=1|nr:sodium:solute symporter family protein [bacterium]HPN33169.1 sodium:solute symporter family protein [bacterium]
MNILGLHIADFSIVIVYILAMLYLGIRAQRKTKNTTDFFMAGRSLGKFYQFFLNFGNSTHADQAAAVSREIYRQGIGGMWIQYLVLFLTPFYWFTALLFRRSRVITLGDFYSERYQSRGLGAAFAAFTLVMAVIGGAAAYMVAGKTMMALTPKPPSAYTVQEKQAIDNFHEYMDLRQKVEKSLPMTETEKTRYETLNDMNKRDELKSMVSYTDPLTFYFIFTALVGVYTMLGGLIAAAFTDAVQGVLIIVFSVMLIPLGLSRIGGFAGLHASVPDYMFNIFGSVKVGEYAWYTIFAMVLANLVSIIASAPLLATAGSAKDEWTARFGILSGMFFKRFLMLFWALTGLVAIALYAGKLHDPDLIWGVMSRDLLVPGALGLMLAGILAANMSSLNSGSVTNSALFIRNLYAPLAPNKSEKHYLNMGRIAILITLVGGIWVATFVGNLLDLFKYFISMPAIFGASIWLGFLWRRVTRWAVILQVIICSLIYAILPNVFQSLQVTNTHPNLIRETNGRYVTIETKALKEDVESGAAKTIGEKIHKQQYLEPTGIFFEKVARQNPNDPNSPRIGLGRFHAEIWVLSWFGLDFSNSTKAQLVAYRFLFDALFPFVLLFLLSYVTKKNDKEVLDYFFAKLHTPVQKTPELEEKLIAEGTQHPEKFEKDKIWKGSNWEILKPGLNDFLGFTISCLFVLVILFLLWLMVNIK